jgi:hypothetical protein
VSIVKTQEVQIEESDANTVVVGTYKERQNRWIEKNRITDRIPDKDNRDQCRDQCTEQKSEKEIEQGGG